jgi:hypothetical protein
MPDDRFEARLRALAQQLSRSISEVDLDEVADRLGVDADRVRGAAGAFEGWLNDRSTAEEPLFSSGPGDPRDPQARSGPERTESSDARRRATGPHPLDLPSEHQGRALSALESSRWTVRPGSGQVVSAEPAVGPPPPDHGDLVGELRARDWITADGEVTLVGRQALLRWCRTAEGADRVTDDGRQGPLAPGPEPAQRSGSEEAAPEPPAEPGI